METRPRCFQTERRPTRRTGRALEVNSRSLCGVGSTLLVVRWRVIIIHQQNSRDQVVEWSGSESPFSCEISLPALQAFGSVDAAPSPSPLRPAARPPSSTSNKGRDPPRSWSERAAVRQKLDSIRQNEFETNPTEGPRRRRRARGSTRSRPGPSFESRAGTASRSWAAGRW